MFKKNCLALLCMYLLVTLMAIYFVMQNKLPLAWDQSAYMDVAAQIGHALRQFDFHKAARIFIWHEPWGNRPAMFMLIGGIFAAITNFNVNFTLILSNMFWVGLIIISTYKLSEYLSPKSGLLSVFMCLSSYAVIFLFRDFYIELSLTAGVILAEYAFFKSQKLLNLKWSLLTLFAMIFGALIKETFVLYVIPLFLYSTYQLIFNPEYRQKSVVRNYLLVYGGSFFLVLFFYLPIVGPLLKNMWDNVGSTVGQFYARPYNAGSLNYYLVYLYYFSFCSSILYLIIPVLGYCSEAYFFKNNPKTMSLKNSDKVLILMLIFLPILVLTIFVIDTNYRFILPILPLTLIGCSSITSTLVSKITKRVVVFLILFIGVCNLVSSLAPLPLFSSQILLGDVILFKQYYGASSLGGERQGFLGISEDYTLVIHELNNALGKERCQQCGVGVLIATPQLNANTFNSYASLSSLPINFYRFTKTAEMRGFEYVVTQVRGKLNYDPTVVDDVIKVTNDYILQNVTAGRYTIVTKITLPDNSILLLIKMPRLIKSALNPAADSGKLKVEK